MLVYHHSIEPQVGSSHTCGVERQQRKCAELPIYQSMHHQTRETLLLGSVVKLYGYNIQAVFLGCLPLLQLVEDEIEVMLMTVRYCRCGAFWSMTKNGEGVTTMNFVALTKSAVVSSRMQARRARMQLLQAAADTSHTPAPARPKHAHVGSETTKIHNPTIARSVG